MNDTLKALKSIGKELVGKTVYLIPKYNRKVYCGIWEDKVQMVGITSQGVHIKGKEHHDHNKTYMLGKTAFFDREEAEAAYNKMEKM